MTGKTTEDAQDAAPPVSWATLKKTHRNTVRSTKVTLRGDLLDEVERLEEDLRRESAKDEWENRVPLGPQIAQRIRVLEDEARESEVTFSFEGMGRGAYAKLISLHKATAEQESELGQELMWNPETFPPALMAASCVEPAELRGNSEEFNEINETWSVGQVSRIWACCLNANSLVADSPKSDLASAALQRLSSASSSTTAPR